MLSYEPVEAHRRWAAGELRIIDCREPSEHASSRIEGTDLVPMSRFADLVDDIPEDLPVAVICRSGARSARVAEVMTADGRFGEVANIEGGIIAWAEADLPYEGDRPG